MEKEQVYHHGDVILIRLSDKEKQILKAKTIHSGESYVLAYGEVTGHKHIITAPDRSGIEILEDAEGRKYLKLGIASPLTHEEHPRIVIDPDIFRIETEREKDYFADGVVRRVID